VVQDAKNRRGPSTRQDRTVAKARQSTTVSEIEVKVATLVESLLVGYCSGHTALALGLFHVDSILCVKIPKCWFCFCFSGLLGRVLILFILALSDDINEAAIVMICI
jgi:hypothetical protein